MSNDLLGDYLKTIGQVSLLSADDEISLGHRVQAMLRIREERPEDDWTKEERRIVRSGDRAKKKMIECNLRLVVSCAKKYSGLDLCKHLEISDLISEGNIGLVRAVEKYDPTRGYKFSTYAYWWIRQGVTRAMTQQDRTIRLPCNAVTSLNNARRFMLDYRMAHGKQPTMEEIAKYCKTPVNTMKNYMRHIRDCGSLDAKALHQNESDSNAMLDFLADPASLGEQEYKLDNDDRNMLFAHIDKLDRRSQKVVKMRFGLDGYSEHTYLDLAKEEKISRERARQIELRAIRKLRVMISSGSSLGKIAA